jgi:16S rRNA A1518/A1519 N6-dimethyltransferase RsmA/KsgA/DIM1 with predicted DNA glycosylase/AP lyase activity
LKRKRQYLGQHLLTSTGVADELIAAAELMSDDVVLEIGTGTGFLTRKISPLVAKVVSFEVDQSLLSRGDAKQLQQLRNVEVRVEDPFDKKTKTPDFDVCLSTLPYSRSRDFVEWLAKLKCGFRKVAIIVQNEFAQKLIARPGNDSYRAISAIAQISFEIELKALVARSAFVPPPKVISRIVTLVPKGPFPIFNEAKLWKIHDLFSRRRKLVSSELKVRNLSSTFAGRRIEGLEPREIAEIIGHRK